MGFCGNFLPCVRFKVVCMDLGEKKERRITHVILASLKTGFFNNSLNKHVFLVGKSSFLLPFSNLP